VPRRRSISGYSCPTDGRDAERGPRIGDPVLYVRDPLVRQGTTASHENSENADRRIRPSCRRNRPAPDAGPEDHRSHPVDPRSALDRTHAPVAITRPGHRASPNCSSCRPSTKNYAMWQSDSSHRALAMPAPVAISSHSGNAIFVPRIGTALDFASASCKRRRAGLFSARPAGPSRRHGRGLAQG